MIQLVSVCSVSFLSFLTACLHRKRRTFSVRLQAYVLYENSSFVSVQFSHSVVSYSLWLHGPQHARLPCPSRTPGACSNSCPSSQWCHPTISSSVVPLFCLQSFPGSESFPMSQFFLSGDQSIGVSDLASVLPMNIQDRFPSGWTGLISLQSKGLKSLLQHYMKVFVTFKGLFKY